MNTRASLRLATAGMIASTAIGCSPDSNPSGTTPTEPTTTVSSCDVPVEQLAFGGVGPDGIAALSNPRSVPVDDPGAAYLQPNDRVIGIEIDGSWLAIPLNLLWYHEVVNLDRGSDRWAVTYCPLTGSSLVFDRDAIGGLEFGVSGLLFNNNLILFDRDEQASLWPQMSRRARCGPRLRDPLPMVPATEMEWQGWRALHPDTQVLEQPTGFGHRYTVNPLAEYESDDELLFFPMASLDVRLPSKARILGVPQGGDGGTAYPFAALGPDRRRALHQQTALGGVVVMWDGPSQGAGVYLTALDGEELTFEPVEAGYTDLTTGSIWNLAGRAVSGTLAGRRLEPLAEAYTSFWFAWASFQPETVIWTR